MIQKIAIVAMVLGAALLFFGVWGRFWMRGALQYLQPGSRLVLLGLGALAIVAGYWFYFDGRLGGRNGPAPKVWSVEGTREQQREGGAAPVVVASIEKPAEDVTPAPEGATTPAATAAPPPAEPAPAEPAAASPEPGAPSQQPVTTSPQTASEPPKPEPAPAPTPAPPTTAASESPAPAAKAAPASKAKPAAPAGAAATSYSAEPAAPAIRRDGTVDVCALQAAGGIAPPSASVTAGKGRSIVIRNALGEGQVREKLKLMIDGREVAEFEISRKNPRSSVRVQLPRGENVSYSLSGYTEYAGQVRREVSGGGWIDGGARTWDVRMAEDLWDPRGGDLFLEPGS